MTGKLEPWAQLIVDSIPTYWEVSPSHTGLKGICRGHYVGNLPTIKYGEPIYGKAQQAEFKTNSGYFTVTGSLPLGIPIRDIFKLDPLELYRWFKPDWLPPVDIPIIPMSEPVECLIPVEIRIKRATAYADKIPGSVTGSGSCHNEALTVASRISVGFDLPREHTLSILRQWNIKCIPPWSESEMDHKGKEVEKIVIDKHGNRRG